jgi:hypothetical protein
MPARPPTVESKAMDVPSGDQRGEPAPGPPKEVTCRTSWPLLSVVQISSKPV